MATEKVLKDSVENILAVNTAMFPALAEQEGELHMLDYLDTGLVQHKISEYQNDPRSRSGGGYLLTELNHIYDVKAKLAEHLGNIRQALAPKEARVRTTVQQAEGKAQEKAITAVAATLKGLSDKVLRSMAESVLAGHADNYTSEKLPYALGYKQITGDYWQPTA